MVANDIEQQSRHRTHQRRRWRRHRWIPLEAIEEKVEAQAFDLLQQVPQFRGRASLFQFSCVGKRLVLQGTVPTFYLKQLAQEMIRPICDMNPGIEIENQIHVCGPYSFVDPGDRSDFE